MPLDITPLKAWVGRTEIVADAVAPFAAAAMAATLDLDRAPGAGEPLPPLWHWAYFQELFRTRDLTGNGHGRHGGFFPPMPLPRRMFAGARLTFHRPLLIGTPARRVSTIADISAKQGASGDLAFLLVRNEFQDAGGTAIVEEQDLVYRAPPLPGTPPQPARRASSKAAWSEEFEANEALLFRYSALIFNAHRIHFDRPYVVEKEGYPGLIVHGQLIATRLAELARRNTDRPLASFRFRSLRPLFDHQPCRLCGAPAGEGIDLWAEDANGGLIMEARAGLAGRADPPG